VIWHPFAVCFGLLSLVRFYSYYFSS